LIDGLVDGLTDSLISGWIIDKINHRY